MTAAERGVLLLCAALHEKDRPLTMAQFRELSLRGQAMRPLEGDAMSEVTPDDVRQLGYSQPDAERIVRLLAREEQLDRSLLQAEQLGIVPLTRITAAYPAPLAQKMGVSCPPVLFCMGDLRFLQQACISVVGSRDLEQSGRSFARKAGQLIAEAGLILVSGGAAGADLEAQEACLEAGGNVIVFTPHRLTDCTPNAHILYVSESGWALPFSVPRAMSRNRLIHVMGRKTLVAQTGYDRGGTWSGAVDNLKQHWSPLFVYDDGSIGATALIARGATPVVQLDSLQTLEPVQTSFL